MRCLGIYYAIIDKEYEGKCAGLGFYFVFADSEKEARELAEKRCEEEKEYDTAWNWKVTEITKVSGVQKLAKFIREEIEQKHSWLLLKSNVKNKQ